jgi:hypothetical protein
MSDIADKQLRGDSQDGSVETQNGTSEAQKEAIKEEIRKMKLKVNGREVEMDEGEVIRRAQLAESAQQRYQEAAQLKKQAEQFFEALLQDPKSVLMHPDVAQKINFRELAEEYLSTELKRELMDPVERELEELREFKRKQEEELTNKQKQEQETVKQRQIREMQQRAAKEYDTKITEALSQSNLPKTAYTVKRVAEILLNAQKSGFDMDIPTAVDMVREGYNTDLQAMIGNLPPDMIIKMFGDDLIKKLRKHDLAQLKARAKPQEQPVEGVPQHTPSPRSKPDAEPKYMKPDEWKEMLRKKAGL